jgi:hypothetical protein
MCVGYPVQDIHQGRSIVLKIRILYKAFWSFSKSTHVNVLVGLFGPGDLADDLENDRYSAYCSYELVVALKTLNKMCF